MLMRMRMHMKHAHAHAHAHARAQVRSGEAQVVWTPPMPSEKAALKGAPTPAPVALATLGRGACFGEQSLLLPEQMRRPKRRTAVVVCMCMGMCSLCMCMFHVHVHVHAPAEAADGRGGEPSRRSVSTYAHIP